MTNDLLGKLIAELSLVCYNIYTLQTGSKLTILSILGSLFPLLRHQVQHRNRPDHEQGQAT